jgi:hypothetical protein
MFKALWKKKLQEFRAKKLPILLLILLVFSFLPLLPVWFKSFPITVPLFFVVYMMAWLLGPMIAIFAFSGDFANQSNRFHEYLPIKRSAIWLVSYLSGLVVLSLGAVVLLWSQVLLVPWILAQLEHIGLESADPNRISFAEYLLPNRLAAVVFFGSFLYCMYSGSVFFAAFLDRKDAPAGNQYALGAMVLPMFVLPFVVVVPLMQFLVVPSALALSPVLLASGALFSAGGLMLFALLPKHLSRIKRNTLGFYLHLALLAALVGLLYGKYLTWRVLDITLPMDIEKVYSAELEGRPDLLLVDVQSYRSGSHTMSLDLKNGAYHDLGRGLTFLEVPKDKSGLLHFWYSSKLTRYESPDYFMSLAPDGTGVHSFKIPCDLSISDTSLARWFPDKQQLVFEGRLKDHDRKNNRDYLFVADSNGNLLKHFEIHDFDCMVNEAGVALVRAPIAEDDASLSASPKAKVSYMYIDIFSGAIRRFELSDFLNEFSKDLNRVLCGRPRIQNGRKYASFVCIELPSLKERTILSEDDLPVETITSPVNLEVPSMDGMYLREFTIDDSFHRMLWLKRRIDGELFRYSIVLIDLNTGKKQEVVPESKLPAMPVVTAMQGPGMEIVNCIEYTADGAGFTYQIGPKIYLCDLKTREATLLADTSKGLDAPKERQDVFSYHQPIVRYSPSGRRIMTFENILKEPGNEREKITFQSAAIHVFQNGKPIQIYTGKQLILGAQWLDEDRILFHENAEIYVLNASGGSPRQVFPPIEKIDP